MDLDPDEPGRVGDAVMRMGIGHAVVTSVNRDELPDGGASVFAATIGEIRRRSPGTTVEVLTPDFRGHSDALDVVLAARPDVMAHNVETVPRLYARVRPQAVYERSLEVLRRTHERAPDLVTVIKDSWRTPPSCHLAYHSCRVGDYPLAQRQTLQTRALRRQ